VTRAYVAVGANLGDRERTIGRALAALAATQGVEVVGVSQLRETDPVGFTDQPRFTNGAVALDTDLPPRSLLARLLEIERSLGRTREGPPQGPRTIDLDLLLYGGATLDEPGLQIPHPRMHERRFVLEPLAELAPGVTVPGRGAVEELLAELD
jgi:2-amino-4-hydroxy-6-hydroxymethyldihydropteridine diphosphokinase